MLLILTHSGDATADYLARSLATSGVPFHRLDTDRALAAARLRYASGQAELHIDGRWVTADEISNVWYRRPEKLVHPSHDERTPEGRYALEEWADALEGFLAHVPLARWMNHPAANAAASQKPEQLTTARRLGFAVPDTLITQDADELRAFWARHRGRLIVKPIGGGLVARDGSEPDSLIYTSVVSEHDLLDLADLASTPTLFQERIEKRSDVRVTVVDAEVYAVELLAADADGHQRCDIRRDNVSDVRYSQVELPAEVRSLVRLLMQAYGLRFGAIDMATTEDGRWVFFEVNPNGQWAWLDLAGASAIAGAFVRSFR